MGELTFFDPRLDSSRLDLVILICSGSSCLTNFIIHSIMSCSHIVSGGESKRAELRVKVSAGDQRRHRS